MSRISLITKTEDEEANKILDEIYVHFGMIPKLWSAYANYPPLLKANWKKLLAVMNEGKLSDVLKQSVAVIVSIQNSCAYCVDAHMMMLDSMGIDASNIENNIDVLGLSEKERLLFNLAKEINKNSTKVDNELFEILRLNNVDIEEVLEIIGVVEVFASYNMFLNAMDIPGGSL
jgi:uncharacterized peroxidase-related enzyme